MTATLENPQDTEEEQALPSAQRRRRRRKAKDELDKLVKDGDVGEDDGSRGEKELDATTKKYVDTVDELLKGKESELLEV